jgi:hypothetical protein
MAENGSGGGVLIPLFIFFMMKGVAEHVLVRGSNGVCGCRVSFCAGIELEQTRKCAANQCNLS